MKPDEKAGQAGPFWTLPVQCTKCVCRYYTEDKWRLSIQESAIQNRQGEKNWRKFDKLFVPVVLRIWNTPHETNEEELALQHKCLTRRGGLEKVWRNPGHIVFITQRPWKRKTVSASTSLSPKWSSVLLSAVSVALAPTSYAPRVFFSALQLFVVVPLPVGQEKKGAY